MILDPEGTVLALFAAFCRIGACFMLVPGIGSYRIPVQIRLFVAVAVSIALLPLMWDSIYPRVATGASTYVGLVFTELLIGAVLGLIARFYTLGLQFAGTTMAMVIGFNAMPAPDIVEQEQQPQLANHDRLHRPTDPVRDGFPSPGDRGADGILRFHACRQQF